MKILLDADASPVLNIVEDLAEKYKLKLLIVKNYNHHIVSDYGKIITVDNIKEAADFYIVNNTSKNDIVITQDYGLAAMVIGKKAFAINQYGLIMDDKNIDTLLNRRHIHKEMRTKHKVYTKFKKRESSDDGRFKINLEDLIIQASKK